MLPKGELKSLSKFKKKKMYGEKFGYNNNNNPVYIRLTDSCAQKTISRGRSDEQQIIK